MFNPFGMNTARRQAGLYNSQNQQQSPYDFKGLENRLGKIETGIAGLTEQFGNFQMPGQETVDPAYTGNATPDPLTPAVPTGGISSLPGAETATPDPVSTQGPQQPTSMADWMRDYEFNMQPQMDTNRWEFERKYREENPIDPIDFSDANRDLAPLHEQRKNMQAAWGQEQEAFRNTPEYQRWKQGNEARGDLSPETMETIQGGQVMSSIGGSTISPYIRGGGGGYEDYLSTHEKMKEARLTGGIDQLRLQGLGLNTVRPNNIEQQTQGRVNAMPQQQSMRQQIQYDPTKTMGGANWTPLGQEEYEKQYDLWGRHMDFRNFSQQAQSHLAGSGQGVGMRMGYNPGFGHAYEAWQQFNQGQEGGPYTDPNQSRSMFGNIQLDPIRDAEQIAVSSASQQSQPQPLNNPLQQGLGAGIGALTGPTQQQIQGYMT